MATSKYFHNFHSPKEQGLMDSLVVESIKIHGVDVFYIPRRSDTQPNSINDNSLSYFDTIYPIEMYVETVEGFGGQHEFLNRFGLSFEKQITFVVARRTFNKYITELRIPRQGDLIFFKMGDFKYMFEIRNIEYEAPFFQFGALYTFTLKCELFTYSSERFSTGHEDIDNIQYSNAYSIEIGMDLGTGDFVIGETVSNGAETTAKVAAWSPITRVLKLTDLTGSVDPTSSIVGANASWTVETADNDSNVNDIFEQNTIFNTENDTIKDWNESNPFNL